MRAQLPMLVKTWFALDLFLVLFPPLHWAASGADPMFGVPRSLLYVLAACAFIALSVVAAYFSDGSLRSERA
jgi:hypothetical protein